MDNTSLKLRRGCQCWIAVSDGGDGVYETLRVFQRKLFKLNQHLEGLHGSLLYSRIKLGMPMAELGTILERLVEENASRWQPNEDYELDVIVS